MPLYLVTPDGAGAPACAVNAPYEIAAHRALIHEGAPYGAAVTLMPIRWRDLPDGLAVYNASDWCFTHGARRVPRPGEDTPTICRACEEQARVIEEERASHTNEMPFFDDGPEYYRRHDR